MENKSVKKKTTKSKKVVTTPEKKDVQKEIKNNDNINVPIPLGFLKHINNVVLIFHLTLHRKITLFLCCRIA